jgi:hypothetical protein
MQINQHKVKGFSKDFIQRYLSGIAEFVKADQLIDRLPGNN